MTKIILDKNYAFAPDVRTTEKYPAGEYEIGETITEAAASAALSCGIAREIKPAPVAETKTAAPTAAPKRKPRAKKAAAKKG